MKKIVLSLVILSLIITQSCTKKETESAAAQDASSSVNEQPSFMLTLLDNTEVNVKDLTGKNALIFFQPDCDHCQREAQEFERNLEAFGGTTLYFITSGPMEEIKAFADTYKLSGRPNVHFAFTQALNVLNNYGPISAPSVYIYSEDHKLVKGFNGETPIERIIAATK
ncbi:MAG: redoxin domain-containing protein [Chryseolinea sp.]